MNTLVLSLLYIYYIRVLYKFMYMSNNKYYYIILFIIAIIHIYNCLVDIKFVTLLPYIIQIYIYIKIGRINNTAQS